MESSNDFDTNGSKAIEDAIFNSQGRIIDYSIFQPQDIYSGVCDGEEG